MKSPWPTKKLGEICEIIVGQAPPSKYYNDEGKGIPFLTVNSFGYIYPKVERWTTKCLRESKKGDVLFSVAGSLGLVNLGINACITRSIFALRPLKNFISQKFLFYTLKKYGSQIALRGSGTAQKVITINQISEFEIPLPSLHIQQKIVKILDMIHSAVEIQDKIIKKTKELKKSLMAELFKYGGPSFRSGRKLKKTEIGEIPENWEVVRLGDKKIAEIKYGKGKPPEGGKIPVIGSSGIYDWTNKALIEKPTIVIGRKGTAGIPHLSMLPCWPSDTAFYLDVNLEKIDAKFLYKYILFKPLSGEHAKTTLPSLRREDLENFKLPLPPLPEQQEIAEILQTIDRKIEIEKKKKELYEELFKTMLNKIMNQEIDINLLDY